MADKYLKKAFNINSHSGQKTQWNIIPCLTEWLKLKILITSSIGKDVK